MNTFKIQSLIEEKRCWSKEHSSRFFKINPGDYAAHDKFIGTKVDDLKKISQQFLNLDLNEILELLKSPFNEMRLCALFILRFRFEKGDEKSKAEIYHFYLEAIPFINNWNLVDSSAYQIVGCHLFERDLTPLFDLAKSSNLWEQRIAIVSTLFFIKKGRLNPTFDLVLELCDSSFDLIQKACGWMLREAFKKDPKTTLDFLFTNKKKLSKTTLRYALERLTSEEKNLFFNRHH